MLNELGCDQVAVMPQMFLLKTTGTCTAVWRKTVDEILFTGPENILETVISQINSKYELGTTTRGPVLIYYYGLNITQVMI